MNRLFLMIITLTFSLTVFGQTKKPDMQVVFDGKNLNHWNVPDTGEWTVKNGVLTVKNNPQKKGSTLWSKEIYGDFVIELDFRFVQGTVDSGIFMRGEDEKNAQIQIGISGSLKRDMTGSPYIPGAGYPIEAQRVKKLLKPKSWNRMRAMAKGNTYTVWLNGVEVMNYTLKNANLNGPVGLQLHPGKEMAIDYRNIQIGSL